ncbi:MAG: alpha/beta hydrolase [Chloroflexota bacterium]|nr:MAG: alpha/beta hydrolase [Chloroflexota bacterium]
MTDQYAEVNGIRLHYRDCPGGDPPLLMLHGLTANAHNFDGLIDVGLSPRFRLLIPDLRGRGLSDKPDSGYTMADHAADILALLDVLAFDRALICGWSFGGYLSYYLAANHPDRIHKVVSIDAPSTLHPDTKAMLQPSIDRLDKVVPSLKVFLEAMKQLPFLDGLWNPALESYYTADVEIRPDGTVKPRSSPNAIDEAADGVLAEDWPRIASQVRRPVLFLNGPAPFGPPGSPALVSKERAMETVKLLPNGRYVQIPGNHMTMGFGDGAQKMVDEITAFILE